MTVYLMAVALHVLGASVWVGGHLLLALRYLPEALRRKDTAVVQAFESRYETIGLPALLLQVLSGIYLIHHHGIPLDKWLAFAPGIGRIVSLKLTLLLATLGLAIHARLVLIPRLSQSTLPALAWHILLVTTLGVTMLLLGVWFRGGGF